MSVGALACLVVLATSPAESPDFPTEIVPVLTRAGCNSGSCHGAAAGRGGLHLSLLGADPAADHVALVNAFEGRRVNLAHPAESLVLLKPTGGLRHGGDVAIEPGSPEARRLELWIAAGAPPGGGRKLTRFEVQPPRKTLAEPGDVLELRAVAVFDGGPEEDVTDRTVITAVDPGSLAVDPARATVKARRPGQHVALARFLGRIVPVEIVVPFQRAPLDLSGETRESWIDELILQKLEILHIPPSPPAEDTAFLRRVQLDLTGRLPTPAEVHRYLSDSSPTRRIALVDRLLASEAFTDLWALRLARLLRAHSLPDGAQSVAAYTRWIREQVAADTPLDAIVRELLTATGDSHVVGPANFARMTGDARGQAELVGRAFLGAHLGCANCHDHPLDRWTQADYHGLAAVFARLDRGREVKLLPRGAVTNPGTGEPAVPRLPGARDVPPDVDPREELARWITDPGTPHLARVTANRFWKWMFGRGLVEPVDDLRVTSPASHPELLSRLAKEFEAGGYSLRHLLREIALSATYARSSAPVPGNELDERFYSHALERPLEPEVLADAIADVTGVADVYQGAPPGTRAVTLLDPLSPAPSLDILGRCSRAGGCDEGTGGGGLPARLHILNGELLNAKLASPSGRIARLLEGGASPLQAAREMWLLAFGRDPRESELTWLGEAFKPTTGGTGTREALEDLVWSLLASRSFSTNH